MTNMICDECETVAHCMKNGCVPKTTKKDEALKLALEALESKYIVNCGAWRVQQDQAITVIREALASEAIEQPAQQEPVAWRWKHGDSCWQFEDVQPRSPTAQPLYTSPPTLSLAERQARSADTWVGLTDEEIYSVLENLQVMYNRPPTTDSRTIFARAIEANLKKKNQ